MKITMLALVMVAAVSWGEAESEQMLRESAYDRRANAICDTLGVSDNQRAAAVPILIDNMRDYATVFRQYESDDGDRPSLRELRGLRSDTVKLRKQAIEKLSDVLTDEQLKAYRKIQDEQRQRRSRSHGRFHIRN